MKMLVRCVEKFGDCDCYCSYDKVICISKNIDKLKEKAENIIKSYDKNYKEAVWENYNSGAYLTFCDFKFEIKDIEEI
jgi:hypothetical protein